LLWLIITTKSHYGKIFNLATSDYAISMIRLAQTIRNILNEPIQINLIPYKNVFGEAFIDVQSRVPSLERLKAFTSFNPQRELKSVLHEIIDYERNIQKKKINNFTEQ
ncbi:MAG TPA: hypothetical protein VI230_07905, partial [Ignavibacteriaceae bacterium]